MNVQAVSFELRQMGLSEIKHPNIGLHLIKCAFTHYSRPWGGEVVAIWHRGSDSQCSKHVGKVCANKIALRCVHQRKTSNTCGHTKKSLFA